MGADSGGGWFATPDFGGGARRSALVGVSSFVVNSGTHGLYGELFFAVRVQMWGDWILGYMAANEVLPEVGCGVCPGGKLYCTPICYSIRTEPDPLPADFLDPEPMELPRIVAACSDGIDNDGDGLIDAAGGDPGCDGELDLDETSSDWLCDDGLDNDGDGSIDLADPGCAHPFDSGEDKACSNGLDDDGDGLMDEADPECLSPAQGREDMTPKCGLGFELALLLPLVALARRSALRLTARRWR